MAQQPEELEVIRGLVIILHAAPHSSTSKFAQMFMKLIARPVIKMYENLAGRERSFTNTQYIESV